MALLEQVLKYNQSGLVTATELKTRLKGTSDSRYGLVKRAIRKGDLINVRRGLYTVNKKYTRKEVNKFELSHRIHGPSYVSFESAMSVHGWIPEAVYTTTAASATRNLEFNTPFGVFSYMKLPKRNFFVGVDRIKNSNDSISLLASPWKAFLDYCYAYKQVSDLKDIFASLRIDVGELPIPSNFELDNYVHYYKRANVNKIIDAIKKEFNL
jgi:hypothetical protein